jgi:WD40 repeat protein
VTIWDTLRGKQIAKSHLADQITGLLIDPTESLLAVSARHFRPGLNPDLQERQIYFELRTIPFGTIIYRSPRKKRSLAAWSFSGDGKMFAAADSGGDVVIMNVRNAKQDESLRPYWILHSESQVSDIDFSKDGRLIAIGAKDGAVRIFDVRARRAIMSVTADEAVSKIRFVRSGQLIASLSTDELEMWKVGSDVEVLRAGTGKGSEFISISADGMKAVLSSEESWTLFQKTSSTTPFQTEKAGSSALLSPGGKYLAVRTPCCLEVLRQADHKLILRIEEPDQEPDPTDSPEIWDNETGMLFPRFSTDDNFLAETPENIWDLRTGKRSSEKGPLHGGAIWADTAEETINEMKISNKCFPNNDCYPDSDLVVTTSRQRVTLTGLSALRDFAISHSGEFAALLTIDGIVQVFSIKTGKELFRVRTDDTSALAFTDDDRALILSTSDGTVYEGFWRTNDIVAETCRRLGRGLTIEEWSKYANGKYQPGCLPLK